MAKKAMQYREARRSYATQVRNRCVAVGVRRALYPSFWLCRICFRELALQGKIPVSLSLHGKRVEVIA